MGGRVTEMAPTDLPEGVSPDEQDNTFIPGAVLTRPNLERVLTNGPPNTTVTYQKSFVMPTGAIKNLYMFSNGELYWEDPINAPKIGNLLYTGPPGSYAKSATMFGREFIAINDTLHGADVPLQWDGVNLDRVTQDGPGAVPTVTSVAPTPSQMVAAPNTLTRYQNTVTANMATAPNPPFKVGYQAQISNVPDSNSTTVNQVGAANTVNYNGYTNWGPNQDQIRSYYGAGSSPLAALTFGGCGFTIPSGATILGVGVSFQVLTNTGLSGNTIYEVALWYQGALLGTLKSPATLINGTPTNPNNFAYGSAADLWGATLTPAIVNDPSFGFAVSVLVGGGSPNRTFFDNGTYSVQVYYTLSGAGTVAYIQSIVIDNETNPGLALVTTDEPHGLAPEEYVSIVGVEPGAIADISEAQWSAGTTTITTKTSHGLNVGSVVQIAGVETATTSAPFIWAGLTGSSAFDFNGTFTVVTVPSPNQITYAQTPITSLDPDIILASANTGSIVIAWPIPDTPTPSYFQVESAPSPTTFYIPINYADGTWTTGTVGYAWSGTFYVTAVISPTQIQYQQYGPNGATTAIGTVTPFGQAAPGFHLMRQNFLTREGALLKSSPYVKFIANGGQYLQIDNLSIGPPNVIARILEFTGADGAFFFYLPIPAQINGQIVSTATQINDNVTTSVLLDFSDNSLYAGVATSIPGNDLIAQIVLDGALGFGQYATRLITYGQRNRIQNFLNMGFAGGVNANAPTLPLGWTYPGTYGSGTLLPAIIPGWVWAMTADGSSDLPCGRLTQPAYQDGYGNPILTGNTQYTFRCKLSWSATAGTNGDVSASFVSTSLGILAVANIEVPAAAVEGVFTAYFEAEFCAPVKPFNVPILTPIAIPEDMQLYIALNTATDGNIVEISEQSVIYTETPYLDGVLFGSYGNNPEGIDGVTGKFGPVTDTRKVMDFGVLRETFYMLTQEPSGRLHETTDNGTTEPSGWTVNEVGANCGALSAFSLTKSQADDTAASGGEEWMAWASLSGARIFGGAYPDKIMQEIQPDWAQINPAAALTVWAVNDPVERALYFGVPLGAATAPSKILFMSYRQLDSAQAIAASPPFRVSFTGKLIATDNSRKWSLWNMSMNGAALMYRVAGTLSLVLGGGNGLAPGVGGFGNVYTLNPNKYTDDDYGLVSSYYYTYGFVNRGAEQQLQVGSHQKGFFGVLATVTWPAGTMLVQVAPNNPANIWPLSCERTVSQPDIDLQWGYGNMIIARGSRFFLKFSSVPLAGQTDNAYNLQMVTIALIPTRLKTRGAAQ